VGLRRTGVAGSTGCPRLNACLSRQARSVRKQVPPATPARRKPFVGFSLCGPASHPRRLWRNSSIRCAIACPRCFA
jgi:hypothetical protein